MQSTAQFAQFIEVTIKRRWLNFSIPVIGFSNYIGIFSENE